MFNSEVGQRDQSLHIISAPSVNDAKVCLSVHRPYSCWLLKKEALRSKIEGSPVNWGLSTDACMSTLCVCEIDGDILINSAATEIFCVHIYIFIPPPHCYVSFVLIT